MRRLGSVARWITAGVLVVGSSTQAVTLGGIGIRPAQPTPQGWFIFKLGPGQRTSNTVVVSNTTDEPQTVQLAAVDAEPTEIGAFGLKANDAVQTGIGKWVELSVAELTLLPNQSQPVSFTLTIPPGTSSGEYAGAITVSQKPLKPSPGASGAFITTRVGVRIYNTVPGRLVRKVKLVNFFVRHDASRQNFKFTVVAKNEGNVTVPAWVSLHLDGFGLVKVPPKRAPAEAEIPGDSPIELQWFAPLVQSAGWQLNSGVPQQETYLVWPVPYWGRLRAVVTLAYEGDSGREILRSDPYLLRVWPWSSTVQLCGNAVAC